VRRIAITTAAMVIVFELSCQFRACAFEEIVNIPGTSNVDSYVVNPVPIELDAGMYKVTPEEPPFPGALYTAYSFYSYGGGMWLGC
jgi:hypothetical protein